VVWVQQATHEEAGFEIHVEKNKKKRKKKNGIRRAGNPDCTGCYRENWPPCGVLSNHSISIQKTQIHIYMNQKKKATQTWEWEQRGQLLWSSPVVVIGSNNSRRRWVSDPTSEK
jgi:hypothetical protein